MRARTFLCLGLVACSVSGEREGEPRDAVSACRGDPPALADCFNGEVFASCGGTGEPRLACDDDSCLWFTTSCVAEGFAASDCPASDVCCHGGWPYVDRQEHGLTLWRLLWTRGTGPWNRTRAMDVTVVLDPSLEHAAAPGISCTPAGTDREHTVCNSSAASAEPAFPWVDDTILFGLGKEFFPAGSTVRVEIDPAALVARVCTVGYTDAISRTCPPEGWPGDCGAGTLTLPRLPATADELRAMPYRLDVALGGRRVEAVF